MANDHNPWTDNIPQLLFWFWSSVCTLIGGFAGGRAMLQWIVRKFEAIEARKQKAQEDAKAEKELAEARRAKEIEDLRAAIQDATDQRLALLESQLKAEKDRNESLWQHINELLNTTKEVKHDVAEVQRAVGQNQDDIQKNKVDAAIVKVAGEIVQSAQNNP